MSPRPDAMAHERAVVAGALGLMLLHTVDEALLHPEAGGRADLALGLVLAGALVALFPRLPRWGRVGALGFLGIQGVVAGTGGHVIHVLRGNAAPLDHSGVLFVLGGAILLTVAAAEARTRGKVLRPNDAGSAGSRPRPPREGSIGAGSRVAGGEHDA